MRMRYQGAWLAVFLSCCGFARAQDCTDLQRNANGPLTVWIVTKPTPPPAVPDISKYREQTAGSFGTASSNVGTPASNHGQPASTLGHNAGDVGTAASNHGQTAGSFGTPAGDVGIAAGDVGQTAGSFGDSLSTVADAGNRPLPPGAPTGNGGQPNPLHLRKDPDPLLVAVRNEFNKRDFEETHVTYVEVPADKLGERLLEIARLPAAQRSAAYPDLLIGSPLPSEMLTDRAWRSWFAPVWMGAASYPPLIYDPYADNLGPLQRKLPDIALVAGAPHQAAAKALLIGWNEQQKYESCSRSSMSQAARPAMDIALHAVTEALIGQTDDHVLDPEIANFSPLGKGVHPWDMAGSGEPHVEVLLAQANEHIAFVSLRILVDDSNHFGIQHPLVVLRKNKEGDWKILQMTADLAPSQQEAAVRRFWHYTDEVDPDKDVQPLGISQASPLDNDNRQPMPELWWDNKGGATMEIVEWQAGLNAYHHESHMFFVDNSNPREETRVRAAFAESGGRYLWRVWSIGEGGLIKLSPWRSFNVLP